MPVTPGSIFPDIPPGLPFYYGSLTCAWAYFPVDADHLDATLGEAGTGLRAARFGGGAGQAYVVVNFQNYTSHASNGLELTVEAELDALAYPEVRAAAAPALTLEEFVTGADTTKLIGGFRLWVPCTDPEAIKYGKLFFGENKFRTTFTYDVPDYNSPAVTTWDIRCDDPRDRKEQIFTLRIADLTGIASFASNQSELTQYSMLGTKSAPAKRLACSRWNILGPYTTYLLDGVAKNPVSLAIGRKSAHPMAAEMRELLGRSPTAAAVQTFRSQPAAVEGRPFYADV